MHAHPAGFLRWIRNPVYFQDIFNVPIHPDPVKTTDSDVAANDTSLMPPGPLCFVFDSEDDIEDARAGILQAPEEHREQEQMKRQK